MKKQKLFLYIVLVLLPFSAIAKTTKYFGIGTTSATLRTEQCKSEWGKFIALGLEYFEPSAPLLVGIEATYTTKKITLENRSSPSDAELYHSGMDIGDITYDGSFFEVAAKIGYHFPSVGNQTAIKLFVGPVISLHYDFKSSFHNLEHLDYNPEIGPYKFDYLRCESEGILPNLSIDGIVGATFAYKAFGVEFRYSRSSRERKCLSGLTIQGELDAFYIFLRYNYNL